MNTMAAVPAQWLIFVANILIPFAVLAFSFGFFPYKPLIPGIAAFDESQSVPPRAFDRVIFMVVDALRSDFVYSENSGFLFTKSLIHSGAAIPFIAYAGAPTVTMPRLKAMTTGSVPSFLDVILNIAESDTSSTLAYQDTWLAQIKAKGGQLVMYGDDTWLKLFPGMFTRADGTTSFYVSDFTEVDANVTRHIPDELVREDWSALIMHYLGLDHIGHKAGPQSSYMIPKQHEMDSIVRQIYEAIERETHLESTLFVLCGDHGMNDAGNHGGSSAGETSPALLFISPKLQAIKTVRESSVDTMSGLQYYRIVDQTDIAPTLAGLLGLPIPLNNLGVFIPELLDMWHLGSQRLQLLLENSKQLLRALKETYPTYSFEDNTIPAKCSSDEQNSIEKAQCAWSVAQGLLGQYFATGEDHRQTEIEHALFRLLRASQELMSSAASDYDIRYLSLGICTAGLAVLSCLPATYSVLSSYRRPGQFLLTVIISYGVMMFASSYVEEEQQFWYWILTGWIFYLQARSSQYLRGSRSTGVEKTFRPMSCMLATVATLAVSHRILRRWNQTGQKYATEPDIARAYFPSHKGILWILVLLTYGDIYLHLIGELRPSPISHLTSLIVILTASTFKLGFAASESPELISGSPIEYLATMFKRIPLVLYARLVMSGILIILVLSAIFPKASGKLSTRSGGYRSPEDYIVVLTITVSPSSVVHEALTLLLMTQSRVTNIPIFLILRLQLKALSTMELSAVEITVTSVLMQYATFFAFGGSNAISSVDLSNAYNGIGNYNMLLVGVLTYVSNWAGPIWWVSATSLLKSRLSIEKGQSHITLLTFFVASTVLSVMAACTVLRTHLFIWTVFSPKYLYTMSWAIIQHFAVNLPAGITCLHLPNAPSYEDADNQLTESSP
ncbi:alkaline-phosphatase-like protein [Aspergillus egyptiacus]|nr:alkaline-phosphatase-like protein [Aspergillus egyptiacus]